MEADGSHKAFLASDTAGPRQTLKPCAKVGVGVLGTVLPTAIDIKRGVAYCVIQHAHGGVARAAPDLHAPLGPMEQGRQQQAAHRVVVVRVRSQGLASLHKKRHL